jgi:hypothetical protein
VLIADPATPAIIAPITAWLRKFGMERANQCAIPGRDKYPIKPIPNPRTQKPKIASFLDKPCSPSVYPSDISDEFRFIARFFHVIDNSIP